MVELFGHRDDERGYEVKYFIEPNSGVVMGFEQHDANPGSPFDERRVGLDHLSWDVESRAELDAWLARLNERGIPHSGIAEQDMWDVLLFRDPDNVQLELIYVKPAASSLTET
jgi:catechol-2,3-dioxygenase